MSCETDSAIDSIRQGIENLNEKLLMIAYQLYISSVTQEDLHQYANIKSFLSEFKNLNLMNDKCCMGPDECKH